ncbi:tetratricopeptide (TPR) repeat protein [Pseudomonas sp. GGS8]|uniref:cellulose biosynthesis protein BcsC n=1 Tax=Pseudomonas sp. GGS8 TaxID=2817892 RepID=UPI00209C8D91|nr:cellulose biosynthesis protein BcsC [Pseudomonas sp. GGS8]MCP1446031.1 tetratricopeptide (TPR) repeat protein [Pseudomonas sp. GGS8]
MLARLNTLGIGLLVAMVHLDGQAENSDVAALLIEQGYYWQEHEDSRRAAQTWTKLLRLAPGQADALYGLGVAEIHQKQLEKARQYLSKLKTVHSQLALQLEQDIDLANDASRQRITEARRLTDAGEQKKAADLYRSLFNGRLPQGQIAREYYNTLAFTDDGWPEARQGLERLLRLRPDDSALLLLLAKHLIRHEDSRVEGIHKLALLSSRSATHADADNSWRLALTWMGPPPASHTPLFEAFLKAHPDDAQIQMQLDKGRALASKEKPSSQKPHLTAALIALDHDDRISAERELLAHLKDHPNDADALGGIGVLRQRQQRLSEAETLLTQAVRQPNGKYWKTALNNVRYWSILGQARTAQDLGRREQARALLDQAIRLDPEEPTGQLALAALEVQDRKLDAAETLYRHILTRHPEHIDARKGLINVLSQTGKTDEALTLIDTLTPAEQTQIDRVGPLRAIRATQLATIAKQRGDLPTAKRYFEEAARNDPANPWTHYALAHLLLETGERPAAHAVLDRLLASPTRQPDTLYSSALLLTEFDEWEKAQTTLEQIPTAQRSDNMSDLGMNIAMHLQLKKAIELARSGQKHESRRVLAHGESLAGQQPERLAQVADAYLDIGDPARAQDVLARLESQPLNAADRQHYNETRQSLKRINEERSAYVVQALDIRSNNSESGLGKLTDIESPFEANIPLNDFRLGLHITPVWLDAGSVSESAANRFGSGGAASTKDLNAIGVQQAQGTGISASFEDSAQGLKADLGTTPIGFLYSTAAGGISFDRPLSVDPQAHYTLNISRRPVTDSLLSFAGAQDSRSGLRWGGVTANGARTQLGYDNGDVGIYGYGAWHKLLGNHVESNTRSELGGGIYWYLNKTSSSSLTAGLNLTSLFYDNNQNYFTYGNGGYFSPQSFYSGSVPIEWTLRQGSVSYRLKGSVGVQHFEQDRADFYPTDSALQAAAGASARYEKQSKTGIAYNVAAKAEYQFGKHLFMGGNLGVDNAQDYTQLIAGLHLRYAFEDMTGPIPIPSP